MALSTEGTLLMLPLFAKSPPTFFRYFITKLKITVFTVYVLIQYVSEFVHSHFKTKWLLSIMT
jgi:hypothetical protein